MTYELLSILAVIAIFSIVQSIFGMGVLVFGTPTLLLMGHDFHLTLGYILPASFTISLLQVIIARSNKPPISRNLYLMCLPGIGIGLWFSGSSFLGSWTSHLIGATLLLSALVRLWPKSRKLLTDLLSRHSPTYHFAMGIIHGSTNLGGAMLAILASSANAEKETVRYTVAHYYLAFSVIQMLLLAMFMGQSNIIFTNWTGPAVAATMFILVGNPIFSRTDILTYQQALTVFIAAYGVAVLISAQT